MSVAIVRRDVPAASDVLAESGIDRVLARLYASRGIVSLHELDCGLSSLPAYQSLKNIEAAAKRLADAIRDHERIAIVADYDADGATACAVGVRGLRSLGADVVFIVPNRFEFGYGLTPEIVSLASAKAPRLIVTVDNGIASHEGIERAAQLGIDVLVTDHHLPGDRLPTPAIIVNPNQGDCEFPSKHIAGVGVMFYVLAATRAKLRERGALIGDGPNLGALLDLVALGTVADVVKLDHVNRILVEQGLRRIRAGQAQPGIAALFRVAGKDARRATATDLGFVAGPRLNAAGRLADMSIGIRCLLSDRDDEAMELAGELDRLNRSRREVEATIESEALAALDMVDATSDAHSLCLYRPDWHQGVVGIVASRLKDRFNRPAIVFARGTHGELKGSGRSIQGLHLRDALDLIAKRHPSLIERFGGHAFAAGLSIDASALPQFQQAFEAVAREKLTPADLARVVESDGCLAPGELTYALARDLENRVWGQGFALPAFDDEFDVRDCRIVSDAHLRLTLERDGARFNAMLFRSTTPLPARIRAVFRPEIDRFQGLEGLTLVIAHWQAIGPG